ncbi:MULTISPECIES: DUF5057 domain-containing protein [Paenibacillus]|uniref:DUF5057 domain-containing protein n=1 Tax=Paenibacillus TaxID=44249 RepID=UPI0022B906B1|nr:DUF5057 domain-containing protein [Paenibacillus caseinilyticus]MCZ8519771.1 DUF5057 domain-containing protein [Paenibacillus caseinilyticus]
MKTRILEITDSGTSDLSGILAGNTSQVELTTLRMKKFVALREDLDGRYDAIYIGKGTYNPTGLPAYNNTTQKHDTTNLQNDITKLKAKEIIDNFVNKGLPVILHTDVLNQVQTGKLYTAFSPYSQSATARDNVIFVNNTDIASYTAFNTKTKFVERAAIRPRFTLTAQPTDYTTNNGFLYQDGDSLTFQFDINNVADAAKRGLIANLYISADQVLATGAEQLVAWTPVTKQTGNVLSFQLPKGFSGLQYWKLEIVEGSTLTKLKDVQSGVFRFRDELTRISVLQILPSSTDGASSGTSSLNKDTNIKQDYLTSSDYAISIQTMEIAAFNDMLANYNGVDNSKLNGVYDMLIFGFRDEYNAYAPISEKASQAVQAFIKTGQAVMFTHDTIYTNDKSANWMKYFQDATGQIDPQTNMGLRAPNKSTTALKVNDGLLTQFPYVLTTTTPTINTTHNQYFTLNLEDRSVIPWYNITGSSRDVSDSWNHYYTYSKGNVTYSGTGHANNKFPDWEQKLFVNTMFRAFIGSNHAPVITAYAPTDYSAELDNFIPAGNDIYVSFKAEDYDLSDWKIKTSVSFTYGRDNKTVVVLPEVQKNSGELVSQGFANPLTEDGDLLITIKATDSKGAVAAQTIKTKVKKVSANLQATRTLSSTKVEKNTPAVLTYTITPSPIAYSRSIDTDDLVIKNMTVTEAFPPNLAVSQIPDTNFKKEGTLAAGYTVTGTLPDITYRRDGSQFVADPVTFTISVTPQQNGSYLLNRSNLTFKDFTLGFFNHSVTRTVSFNTFNLDAVTTMTSLGLVGKDLRLDDEDKLIPTIGPQDTSNQNLTWTSLQPEIVSVSQTGVIRGVKPGQATIHVASQDGSNLTATAVVNVITPGLNIVGPATMYVGESVPLKSNLFTANESATSYVWTVSEGGVLSPTDQPDTILEATKTGVVKVGLTVQTDKGRSYNQEVDITILEPTVQIGEGPRVVDKNGTLSFQAVVTPSTLPVAQVQWSVKTDQDRSAADFTSASNSLTGAVLRGIAGGKATVVVTVTTDKGRTYAAETDVAVRDAQITGGDVLTEFTSLTISGGVMQPSTITGSLLSELTGGPLSYLWSVPGGSVVDLTNAGSPEVTLYGKRPGTAALSFAVNGIPAQRTITVVPAIDKLGLPKKITVVRGKQTNLWSQLTIGFKSGVQVPITMEEYKTTRLLGNLGFHNSDASKVAITGNEGTITGIRLGRSTITVTYNGLEAKVLVEVIPPGDLY